MIIVPYSFNPNRSLDRCVYSFPLIQVSLCHISITFGILSPSLSRLSLLCLRQRCGQSARNKHHLHHLEGKIKFQPSIADAGARGHFVFQTIHILFLGIPTHLVCLLQLVVLDARITDPQDGDTVHLHHIRLSVDSGQFLTDIRKQSVAQDDVGPVF